MSLTNGEQKIFLLIDTVQHTGTVLEHGIALAKILRKSICLLHLHGEHKTSQLSDNLVVTSALQQAETMAHPQKVLLLESGSKLDELLSDMAEAYDALALVAHKSEARRLLPALPEATFPFLFVSEGTDPLQCFRRITLPVGYMKKCKDLALWSSYLARHNQGHISLVRAMDADAKDKERVMNNIRSIERLFRNFSFPYDIVEFHQPSWKIQKAALEQASGFGEGMLVISFTYHSTLFDRLFHLDDGSVIRESGNLSVLCINSQRDLYCMCS